MNYFLAKTDPDTYSIDDFERERRTVWDGVANAQAVSRDRECALAIACSFIIAAAFRVS